MRLILCQILLFFVVFSCLFFHYTHASFERGFETFSTRINGFEGVLEAKASLSRPYLEIDEKFASQKIPKKKKYAKDVFEAGKLH